MSTLYKVYNKISNREYFIGITEDFDKLCSDFDSKAITENKALNRLKKRDQLAIERLEDVDNVPERYAYYTWPQTKRIEYSSNLVRKSLKKGMTKYLIHSVDRIIDLFPETDYSFKFSVDEDDTIIADVYKNGVAVEGYSFKKMAGTPNTRIIY